MTEDVCSWDRRPGEPSLWFSRFEAYRLEGPGRHLLSLYRRMCNRPDARNAGGCWRRALAKWEWKKRAAAWDEAEILKARGEDAERRKADKAQRIKLLQAYRGKITQAMVSLEPLQARWRDVTDGLFMVVEQLRKEFGDDVADALQMDITLRWPDAPAEAQRKAEELEKRISASGPV